MEAAHVYSKLGASLNRVLQERKVSQADLASRLGVSRQVVNAWVHGGKIPFHTITALADHLGVSLDELAGLETPTRTDLSEKDQAILHLADFLDRLGVEEVVRRLVETERPKEPTLLSTKKVRLLKSDPGDSAEEGRREKLEKS